MKVPVTCVSLVCSALNQVKHCERNLGLRHLPLRLSDVFVPGDHRHRRVAGYVKVPGVKVKIALSDFAGGYTPLVCQTMVAGFEDV